MKVSDAIEILQQEDQDSEIMIEWFTKQDVESHIERQIDTAEWDLASHLYNKYGITEEVIYDIVALINVAKERIEARK